MTASKPLELLERDIPQVHAHARRVLWIGTEHAVREKAGVQAGHVVSRGLQDRHHHSAEIALMACDQYSHIYILFSAVLLGVQRRRM